MFRRTHCALLAFFFFIISDTYAQSAMPTPAPPIIGAKSYLIIDAQTGHELAALDPDLPLAPASLTKIMTTYVVFSALRQGQVQLADEVTISEKA